MLSQSTKAASVQLEHEANLGVESISSNNMNFKLTRTYKPRPKCVQVVCVHLSMQLQFSFAVCILHFASRILHLASCILQVAFYKICPAAKTDFSKRIHKVHVQLCYVGLQIELRVHLQLNIHMQPEMTKTKASAFGGSIEFQLDIRLSEETYHACNFL